MKSIEQQLFDYDALEQTHDLSLPDWGPYSSRTFGLSHIHSKKHGNILDVVLMGGFYRRPLAVPDARRASNGIPWKCSSDLKYYSYRQQIEWKDKVYYNLEFTECAKDIHHLRCNLVNNTNEACELAAQILVRMIPLQSQLCLCNEALEILHPLLKGCNLQSDMMNPKEEYSATPVIQDTCYKVTAGETVQFISKTSFENKDLYLVKKTLNDTLETVQLPCCNEEKFEYIPQNDEIINRLLVLPKGVEPKLNLSKQNNKVNWEEVGVGKYIVHFDDDGDYYGIWSLEKPSHHRNYLSKDILQTYIYKDYVLQKHYGDSIFEYGGVDGGFSIAVQPLYLSSKSEKNVDFIVYNGTKEHVLESLNKNELPTVPSYPTIDIPSSPYNFSLERMASVVMTNVVFPIRCDGQFVRNHTPGRLWNCLYTWDSGFIGLALLDLDFTRAVENLNAYLSTKDNTTNAFVLHGTPLPMQIFLLFELWNRSCNLEMLKHFYPRVKRMYDYLAGHTAGSKTRSHCNEPFICTWDYFYNSGGWDDYPPQWERFTYPEKYNVIPAISSSGIIRAAKLLKLLAQVLGEETDIYDKDIEELTNSLQKYSWDEECGYFSYVNIDKDGNPDGFFRYVDGSNYNMGLDGTSPLIADAVTLEQKNILWEKVQSKEHLWTNAGISTVDISASYYTPDGYWNGCVWMPHQWLLWKAALNDGMGKFAEKIAKTALNLWEKETKRHYCCFEQFTVSNSTGNGWHHFSGLSSPIICWHRAYFEEGALTTGFDVIILGQNTNSWKLKIAGKKGDKTTLILGGQPKCVTYKGKEITYKKTFGNSVIFNLPKNSSGLLEVSF